MVLMVSSVSALGTVDLYSGGVDVCHQQKADMEATQFQVSPCYFPYSSRWVLFSSTCFFSSLLHFPSRERALRWSVWLRCRAWCTVTGMWTKKRTELEPGLEPRLSLSPPRATTMMLEMKASCLHQLAKEKWY